MIMSNIHTEHRKRTPLALAGAGAAILLELIALVNIHVRPAELDDAAVPTALLELVVLPAIPIAAIVLAIALSAAKPPKVRRHS